MLRKEKQTIKNVYMAKCATNEKSLTDLKIDSNEKQELPVKNL